MDPCGTPIVKYNISESDSSISTYCFLFEDSFLKFQLTNHVIGNIHSSLLISISWFSISNGLERSKNMLIGECILSISKVILSTNSNVASSVEWPSFPKSILAIVKQIIFDKEFIQLFEYDFFKYLRYCEKKRN